MNDTIQKSPLFVLSRILFAIVMIASSFQLRSQNTLAPALSTQSQESVIIDLVEFKVSTPNDQQSIPLEWTIAGPNQLNTYTIERKDQNGKFMAIGTTSNNYFTDYNPMLGSNVYRLSVITTQNKMFHSKSIQHEFSPIELKINSNPVCDHLIVSHRTKADEPFTIELRDKFGNVIHRSNHLASTSGQGQTTLSVNDYKPELYFVLIIQNQNIVTKMFRIQP